MKKMTYQFTYCYLLNRYFGYKHKKQTYLLAANYMSLGDFGPEYILLAQQPNGSNRL